MIRGSSVVLALACGAAALLAPDLRARDEQTELKRLQGQWFPHKTEARLPDIRWDIQVFKSELVISHARGGGGMMVAVDTYRTIFSLKADGKRLRLIPGKESNGISEIVLRVEGNTLIIETGSCGKVNLKGEWRRVEGDRPPEAGAGKKANPARLAGMKAALAHIEAGKLKLKSLPLPDPAWYGRYLALLKSECGVHCELVVTDVADAIAAMHGYNDVMQVQIDHRFGRGVMERLAKRAQDEHFKGR